MHLPKGQPLVTASEMAAIDHATTSGKGITSLSLMERAGRESARVIIGWWRGITATPGQARRRPATTARPPRGRVIVLAGPGNNGGDGFVCARYLKTAGFTVRVLVAAEEGSLSKDSGVNYAACEKERMPVTFLPDARAWGPGSEAAFAANDSMFLVDALLGTGSRGAARGAVAAAIEMAEQSEKPIASID
ncbi:MAG TPA: NAD(P)H-hydrate epimerase, partial [Candidatus Limnocylindrales bacterium]|nr:NAD(P)H-hydrate epimerase [Candidatus Limnocylindrales bacterium]